MILESIVTTTNADGSTNVSPMGPRITFPESLEEQPHRPSLLKRRR